MKYIIQSISKISFIALFALSINNVYANNHVDCNNAQSDIAKLEQEKKDTDDRIAKGVFSVLPIGLALNAMQSAGESDTGEMDSKEYRKQLEERINEIKSQCDIK
jgi:hypothetical protein